LTGATASSAGSSQKSAPAKVPPAGSAAPPAQAEAKAKAKAEPAKAKAEPAKDGGGGAAAPARDMAPANGNSGRAEQKTLGLYLEDTYLFEHTAKLLDVWQDGEKVCLELDQTIFHPQGGGQPCDVGSIVADGLPPLEVIFVQLDKERLGVVRHDCKGDFAAWSAAKDHLCVVTCKVDEEKRRLFARTHSAGHLLDVAVHDLGFRWTAGKGYHFPDGPYVEYIPTAEGRQLDNKDAKAKDAVIAELDARMKELIARASPVSVTKLDGVRTVAFEDVSCGCGGTHVKHGGELGGVVVKKLQAKQGNMRVSYSVN